MHAPFAIAAASLALAGCTSAVANPSPPETARGSGDSASLACEVFFQRQSMDLFDMPVERAAFARDVNQHAAVADSDANLARAGRMLILPTGASRASWRSSLDYFGARCLVPEPPRSRTSR